MALSAAFVDAHIAEWEAKLDKPYQPYRKKWPSKLFHHCPIENAAQILLDGNLRSRSDAQNNKAKDVAAAGVIHNTVAAHDFGRIYFRPKTPTQWHIEGIRKADECNYGEATHAPVLVMLVFDAKKTLLHPGTKFSDKNMQLNTASFGDDEQFFSGIPFAKVFHEGGTGGDHSIIDHRCAEVLVQSPFPLVASLANIVCRTSAERDTLLFLLGKDAGHWKKGIIVSEDALAFYRDYTFVEDVSMSSKGLSFRISPRRDRKPVDTEISVWDSKGTRVLHYASPDFNPAVNSPDIDWIIEKKLADGTYRVQFSLEKQMAYQSKLTIGNKLI